MSSHEQSEKCEYLSQHDDLTGLLNRLGFFKIVNKTIKKDAPCVAMCFDLNQFKPINDTY
jgi:GGDEF domain-containing protein